MTWRGVVFNANNIVGKLLGRGVGGRDVFKYLELNWHMRLCHVQLCWPLVCGCLRLPCRDLAESGNRSVGISPAETSPKAVIGVLRLSQPGPRNKCGRMIKTSYLPLWDLASGGTKTSYLPWWDLASGGNSGTSYWPWWDLASGGNTNQLFAMVGPRDNTR